MLRRNLDVSRGLVNGRIGTITDFTYEGTNNVSKVNVHFDGDDWPTPIERVTVDFEVGKGVYATRTQFPLLLSWSLFHVVPVCSIRLCHNRAQSARVDSVISCHRPERKCCEHGCPRWPGVHSSIKSEVTGWTISAWTQYTLNTCQSYGTIGIQPTACKMHERSTRAISGSRIADCRSK